MKTKFILLYFCGLILIQSIKAQITTQEVPPSFKKQILNVNTSSKVDSSIISITPPNMEKVMAEDMKNDTMPNILHRTGIAIPVNLSSDKNGVWSNVKNDSLLWTITINVVNALSLDLVFDKFWLPTDGKLFVFNKQTRQVIGGITNEFLKGSKKNPFDFSTGILVGDELTLEYYQPASINERPIISISKIYYGYRDIPFTIDVTKSFGESGNCQVNINCSEGQNWQKEKSAVARILVKLPYAEGWCSGSLINNSSYTFEPLFLTANHCLDGAFDAINNPNLSQWVFYWDYEFPGCNNLMTEPTIRSTIGANVRANNDDSDFALLMLTQDPRNLNGFIPYYLGWDRSGDSGIGGVGIHHPRGDVKKIATYNTTPINSTCRNQNFWMTGFIETALNHHSVMEPGSSGSPLINSQRKVIGQLLGPGNLDLCPEHLCGNNPELQRVSYGKFSVSWTGNNAIDSRRRLRDWLSPNGLNPQTLNGNGIASISISSQSCQGPFTFTINNLPLESTVSWYANGLSPYSGTDTTFTASPVMYAGTGYVSATVTVGQMVFTLQKDLILNGYVPIEGPDVAYLSQIKEYFTMDESLTVLNWKINGQLVTPSNPHRLIVLLNNYYPGDVLITCTVATECGTFEARKSLEIINDYDYLIYPNPATDLVTVSLAMPTKEGENVALTPTVSETVRPYSIQLWNERAGLVKTVETDKSTVQIPLYGLPKGMYYVHLIKDKKMIKKQILWIK